MSTFAKVLEEINEMHRKKQADYGSDNDPFANIRASELFGMPAWLGAVIRANDKISRIQAFSRKGRLANETVEDSLLDLAVYAVIALTMYREEQAGGCCDCPASEHCAVDAVGVSKCTGCGKLCRQAEDVCTVPDCADCSAQYDPDYGEETGVSVEGSK